MRWIVISFSSKSRSALASEINLSLLLDYISSLLTSPNSVDMHSMKLEEVAGHDDKSILESPKKEKCNWEMHLLELFSVWYKKLEDSQAVFSQTFSAQHLIRRFCDIGRDPGNFFEVPQNVSIFLSIATEMGGLALDFGPIDQTSMRIKESCPTLLKWLASRAPEHIPPSQAQFYSARLAFRYFVFEFLRKHPDASEDLWMECGLEARRVLEIWKEVQSTSSQNTTDYSINRGKRKTKQRDFLADRGTTQGSKKKRVLTRAKVNGSQETTTIIAAKFFKLFCIILYVTPLNYWSQDHMKAWERILFKDRGLLRITPISQDIIRSALRASQGFSTNWRHRTFVPSLWRSLIWPQVLIACRSVTDDSDDWILILAIASIRWGEITGSHRWRIAALEHAGFWNFVFAIEKHFDLNKPCLSARIARRYLILQDLSKNPNLEAYGIQWNNVSRSMWEATKDLRDQSLNKSVDELRIDPSDSTAFMTRTQFSRITQVALGLKEKCEECSYRQGESEPLDEQSAKRIIMSEILSRAETSDEWNEMIDEVITNPEGFLNANYDESIFDKVDGEIFQLDK